MAIEDLTPEERERLFELAKRAGLIPSQDNPEERGWGEAPAPNPPELKRILDPVTWVSKQIDTLRAVGEANYLTGVKNPKKDPIAEGIAAQAKYEAEMKKAEVLARRAEALRKTNIGEWAAMAERLGARKLVEGVLERRYKVERFVSKFQPKLLEHVRKIDAMPEVTDADREKRMLENLRGLKALKGKW